MKPWTLALVAIVSTIAVSTQFDDTTHSATHPPTEILHGKCMEICVPLFERAALPFHPVEFCEHTCGIIVDNFDQLAQSDWEDVDLDVFEEFIEEETQGAMESAAQPANTSALLVREKRGIGKAVAKGAKSAFKWAKKKAWPTVHKFVKELWKSFKTLAAYEYASTAFNREETDGGGCRQITLACPDALQICLLSAFRAKRSVLPPITDPGTVPRVGLFRGPGSAASSVKSAAKNAGKG